MKKLNKVHFFGFMLVIISLLNLMISASDNSKINNKIARKPNKKEKNNGITRVITDTKTQSVSYHFSNGVQVVHKNGKQEFYPK